MPAQRTNQGNLEGRHFQASMGPQVGGTAGAHHKAASTNVSDWPLIIQWHQRVSQFPVFHFHWKKREGPSSCCVSNSHFLFVLFCVTQQPTEVHCSFWGHLYHVPRWSKPCNTILLFGILMILIHSLSVAFSQSALSHCTHSQHDRAPRLLSITLCLEDPLQTWAHSDMNSILRFVAQRK